MKAVRRGNPEMVKLLLRPITDVSLTPVGNTPIVMSADRSFVEMNAGRGDPPPVPSSKVMSLLLARAPTRTVLGSTDERR